jgi:hypothetical protein
VIGDRCVPAPLGIQGELNTGELLSGFSPGLEARLQYLLTPGSYVQAENEGLSLGVIGGAQQADQHGVVCLGRGHRAQG